MTFLRRWFDGSHYGTFAELSSIQVIRYLKGIGYEGDVRWSR